MKVYELFEAEKIDDEFIAKHFDGSYWDGCNNFINENWEREIESLSTKQASWFTKILDDCVECRIDNQ